MHAQHVQTSSLSLHFLILKRADLPRLLEFRPACHRPRPAWPAPPVVRVLYRDYLRHQPGQADVLEARLLRPVRTGGSSSKTLASSQVEEREGVVLSLRFGGATGRGVELGMSPERVAKLAQATHTARENVQ